MSDEAKEALDRVVDTLSGKDVGKPYEGALWLCFAETLGLLIKAVRLQEAAIVRHSELIEAIAGQVEHVTNRLERVEKINSLEPFNGGG